MKSVVTALLVSVASLLGCGGDSGPTAPSTSSCTTRTFPATVGWATQGGCEGGVIGLQNGASPATYVAQTCVLTTDITPPAVKAAGGSWTLTADLRNGTASVVRANTACPNTDTGTVQVANNAVIASLRAPADPSCSCRLNYAVNIGG